MNGFKSLRLATQLLTAFVLVALFSGVVGLVAYRNIHKINDADTWLYEKCAVPLGEMGVISGNFNRIRVNEYRTAIASSTEEARKAAERILALDKEIEANVDGYAKALINAEDEANYKKMKADLASYRMASAKVLEFKLAGKDKEALAYVEGSLRKDGSALAEFLDKMVDLNVKSAKEASDANDATAVGASRTMVATILVAMAGSVALGLLVTRVIKGQVGGEPREASDIARRVAEGDLTVDVAVAAGDTRSMMFSIRTMVEKLSGVVGQVQESAGVLVSASEQLSSTAQSISQGASEQAASVEETSASMEEMSASIAQNNENARSPATSPSAPPGRRWRGARP